MVQHLKSVSGFLVIHLSLFWLKLKTTSSNKPTRMKPLPIPPATQLAMCLYRLTHRCLVLTVGNLFGVAAPTAYCFFFQDVCKALVKNSYEGFVFSQEPRRSGARNCKVFSKFGSSLALALGTAFTCMCLPR